jgi:hypothetical protein
MQYLFINLNGNLKSQSRNNTEVINYEFNIFEGNFINKIIVHLLNKYGIYQDYTLKYGAKVDFGRDV